MKDFNLQDLYFILKFFFFYVSFSTMTPDRDNNIIIVVEDE